MSGGGANVRLIQKNLRKCVQHVCQDGKHFSAIVCQSQHPSPILRAVFVIDDYSGEPLLRRASPVALKDVAPAILPTLEQLHDTVGRRDTQFVAWISVETQDDVVLGHTAIIVDVHDEAPVWEGGLHIPGTQPPAKSPQRAGSPQHRQSRHRSSSRTATPTKADSRVPVPYYLQDPYGSAFTDPFQNVGEVRASDVRGGSHRAELTQVEPIEEQEALPRGVERQAEQHREDLSARRAEYELLLNALKSRDTAIQVQGRVDPPVQKQLEEVKEVSHLVAKATAKLAQAVDDAQARLDRLFDMMSPLCTGPSLKELADRSLGKLEGVELRLRCMEELLASLEVHHERLFRNMESVSCGTQVDAPTSFLTKGTQTEAFEFPAPPVESYPLAPDGSPGYVSLQQRGKTKPHAKLSSATPSKPLMRADARGNEEDAESSAEETAEAQPAIPIHNEAAPPQAVHSPAPIIPSSKAAGILSQTQSGSGNAVTTTPSQAPASPQAEQLLPPNKDKAGSPRERKGIVAPAGTPNSAAAAVSSAVDSATPSSASVGREDAHHDNNRISSPPRPPVSQSARPSNQQVTASARSAPMTAQISPSHLLRPSDRQRALGSPPEAANSPPYLPDDASPPRAVQSSRDAWLRPLPMELSGTIPEREAPMASLSRAAEWRRRGDLSSAPLPPSAALPRL